MELLAEVVLIGVDTDVAEEVSDLGDFLPLSLPSELGELTIGGGA